MTIQELEQAMEIDTNTGEKRPTHDRNYLVRVAKRFAAETVENYYDNFLLGIQQNMRHFEDDSYIILRTQMDRAKKEILKELE